MRYSIILPIVIYFALLFSSSVKAGNMSSWRQETPFGNIIEYSGDYSYSLLCENRNLKNWRKTGVENITKWYFYKGHIVGNYYARKELNWFIFNEKTGDVSTYANELDFDSNVKKRSLKPFLWTRWYSSGWGYIINANDGLLTFPNQLIIKILLIILSGYVFLTLFLTKFTLSRKINKVNILIVGIILSRILLDIFPQSF